MNIAIYCGSSLGNDEIYKNKTIEFIHELKKQNINMVYGGSVAGLMGIASNTAVSLGLDVIGVITEDLATKEIENKNITKTFIVDNLSQRKDKMASLSDAFIALPGGYGTLDEIFEVITYAQLGIASKPCIFYNINGYYDKLIDFLKESSLNGFIEKRYVDMIIVSDNPKEIIRQVKNYKAPKDKWS